MEKEFVSFEIALALKELGFNEKCFGFYDLSHKCRLAFTSDQNFYEQQKCSAPTFSQAFRFFRERYHLIGCIDFHASYKNYMYNIKEFEYITHRTRIETYEDAEIECLKKLIEIAKEQNVK